VARNGATTTVGGDARERAFFGYLGRLSYDYAQRYLLTATVRRDGTSTFSPEGNRRWGTFPSVSAAWRVSEEPFFRLPGVSEFKLRGSWGELGNSETAAYPFITRVSPDVDYGLGGSTTLKAPTPVNLANPDVTWETSAPPTWASRPGCSRAPWTSRPPTTGATPRTSSSRSRSRASRASSACR
jgi:hypothetical protein